ncbi:MAG: glycosyltransferase family 2 protein [Prevotellaceae bacterium]|jgi:glycosyltransferase involved in cell wall biosynthesis|nr:glycosyltransferase family 2 protein [Prevotellaceae bacterium]
MFSIIICTYNRAEYIYKTLQCIAGNDFPVGEYEVLLINNNSTDNTEQECSRFSKDYPTSIDYQYFVETKQGLSHARNRGIEESKYDMLIFLDDDSFVKNDYLFNLKGQLRDYNDAIAFGGKIAPIFESGVEPKWISKWSYSWVSALDKGSEVVLFKGKSYPVGANMGFSIKVA